MIERNRACLSSTKRHFCRRIHPFVRPYTILRYEASSQTEADSKFSRCKEMS